MATRAQAEAAAVSLRAHLATQPWFAGADIAQLKCGGDSAEVMAYVRGSWSDVRALVSCPKTPRTWQGVPLQFVRAAEWGSLSGAPLTTQDYANVALGVMVLYGTFMVGKIAVDSIVAARQEHFERKGQPPAAVVAKESTLDGIVKVLGMGYSFYVLSQQLPVVLTEAQKLLE
jgi:hypothetical protein